jgi:hypothetical protein
MLLLALAACAPGSESAGLPQGISVELRQSRADVAARQAMVSVHNGTDRPLEVGDVSVADARFSAPAERVVDRTSTVAPGATVDIRVQLAEVVCGVADEAGATVSLAYRRDGHEGTAVVPIADTVPFVADLHARECLRADALRSAAVELGGFAPSAADAPATLDLVVTPQPGEGDLRITGIRETNLLTFAEVDAGLHRLDIDQTGTDRTATTVGLPLLPLRCDPHAVQEDKRGTVFRVFVRVGGRDGSFDVAASPELRGEILGWIADWCGFGGD